MNLESECYPFVILEAAGLQVFVLEDGMWWKILNEPKGKLLVTQPQLLRRIEQQHAENCAG